jgi:hypothetical protein
MPRKKTRVGGAYPAIRRRPDMPEWLVDQQGYQGTDEAHHEDASSRYGD